MKNPFKKHFKFFMQEGTAYLEYNGPKPKNLNQAFLISLAKWGILSDDKTTIRFGKIDDGQEDTCGLCMWDIEKTEALNLDELDECHCCPVFKYTEMENCEGTPYRNLSFFSNLTERSKIAKAELAFILKLYKKFKRMKNPKYVLVKADDWQGLFVDGKLVFENHSISLFDLQRLIPEAKNSEIETRYVTEKYDEELQNRGCFPKNLTKVRLQKK